MNRITPARVEREMSFAFGVQPGGYVFYPRNWTGKRDAYSARFWAFSWRAVK